MSDFKLDFIGVGAAKAGTTWLATCLSEHPQVCISKPKELHYFCLKHMWPKIATHYDEGEQWLRARFSHWKVGQIRGEISPSYLVDPMSPILIKDNFPETKIIMAYRNPADSLYSLYCQLAKGYPVPNRFEDFLKQYPYFVDYGFYYKHTKRYFEHFSPENMHCIVFDEIRSGPEKVLLDLFAFLGIESYCRPRSMYKRINEKRQVRSVLIRNSVAKIIYLVNARPQLIKIKRSLKRLGIHHIGDWIMEINLREASFPPMAKETRHRLLETYAKDITLLGNLLKRDLSNWNR